MSGFFNICQAAQQWEYKGSGAQDADLKLVAVSPTVSNRVYIAGSRYCLKSEDGGSSWKTIFGLRGQKTINFMAVSKTKQEIIYVATDDGLYASDTFGLRWKKLFTGISDELKNVTCVLPADAGVVYISTDNGVFITEDGGKLWRGISKTLSSKRIRYITQDLFNSDVLFAATDAGIEKSSDKGLNWNRVYTIIDHQNDEGYSDETNETDNDQTVINVISQHPVDRNTIYAGTNQGVLISKNRGQTWGWMSSYGLVNENIKHLLVTNADNGRTDIYAATPGGAYCYDGSRQIWMELYEGLPEKDVRFLAMSDNPGDIWVATKKGAFKTETLHNKVASQDTKKKPKQDLSLLFKGEPTIRQVQAAAIKYAEVHPNKIRNWRRQASVKALLPEFSLDYDKTVNYDSGSDAYYIGPRDWGFGFSWDVSELIYNDDQTGIDVRSKLMVQLRDDVLDEVTRLYFERRRLMAELYFSPPQDTKTKFEKELRLQELTAGIDGLTGGYFSRYNTGKEKTG